MFGCFALGPHASLFWTSKYSNEEMISLAKNLDITKNKNLYFGNPTSHVVNKKQYAEVKEDSEHFLYCEDYLTVFKES